jgi:hypothetical protein
MLLKRRRPDKQSAIRQTARTSPTGAMPDGGYALSGLQNQTTNRIPVGRISKAPSGKQPAHYPPAQCLMAASPYQAYETAPFRLGKPM